MSGDCGYNCAIHISENALSKLLDSSQYLQQHTVSCDLRPEEISGQIDYLDKAISYEEFFFKYIAGNRPCIIGKWITEDWKARTEWVSSQTSSSNKSSINYRKLQSLFGHAKVPVADCDNRYYNSQCKEDMVLTEYLSYMEERQKPQSCRYDTAVRCDRCLYLKDWHFVSQFPKYKAYHVPKYFMSDWLNEVSDVKLCDDFRFVYIGPKGSWTPFHADVYRSFSWSANISGKKKWLLFPPGEENKLKSRSGELPYDISDLVCQAHSIGLKVFDVTQDEGEVIFVPSGWFHQVHNLEDTISINHNWFNGANVANVVRYLLAQAGLVKSEIKDCKTLMTSEEWHNQCELILRADAGMNIKDLIDFLASIAYKRCFLLNQFLNHSYKTGDRIPPNILKFINNIKKKSSLCVENTETSHEGFNDSISQLETTLDASCHRHVMFDLYTLFDTLNFFNDVDMNILSTIQKLRFDIVQRLMKVVT